jgi:hypothetical protein
MLELSGYRVCLVACSLDVVMRLAKLCMLQLCLCNHFASGLAVRLKTFAPCMSTNSSSCTCATVLLTHQPIIMTPVSRCHAKPNNETHAGSGCYGSRRLQSSWQFRPRGFPVL